MNGQRRGVALVGGMAVLLGSTVLTTIFGTYGWAMYVFLATGAVVLVALLARTLRFPLGLQFLAMLLGLLFMLTWTFPSGHEIAGFIPDLRTLTHFNDLFSSAGHDIQTLAVPVNETPALEFLVAVGLGLVAITVDVLAVGLRHPALAGLPLLAMYSVPVAIHTDSVSWIPFAAGAAGYLWLLMTDHVDRVRRWGRRFTGDGRDVETWEPSPLAAAGRRVGFAGLVLAVVLPLAVPGFSNGLLGRLSGYNNGNGTGNGTSSTGAAINPITTLRGNLRQGQPIDLFQLATADIDPGYLRTAVADQITESGFAPGPNEHSRRLDNGPDEPPAALTRSLHHTEYQAKITANQLNDRYLPLFGSVVSLHPPGGANWRYQNDTGVVYADHPATVGQNWSFAYDSFDYTPKALRGAPTLDARDPAVVADTEVPRSTAIAKRVDTLVAGQNTEYDKVRAILDSFAPSNGFRYSLQTRPGTSGSAIVDFLTNKRGYCEQYASAMAWMVRQAGIPSRVVVGYTHGAKLGNADVYQITSHEAHAWVEVYFPTFGWVPFDPTPSTEVSGSATFGWAPNPAAVQANGSPAPGSLSAGGRKNQASDPSKGQHGGATLRHASGAAANKPVHWPYWVLGVLLLLAILAIPAMRRLLLHRRRTTAQRRAGPTVTVTPGAPPGAAPGADARRRGAHAAWDDLMDTLVDLRMETDQSETPRGTAERLTVRRALPSDAADAVRVLAHAEERARYARDPLLDGDLPGSSRLVRATLIGQATRARRIGAAIAPRSVLRRWRTGLVSAVTGGVAAIGRAQQRVVHGVLALRPRQLNPDRRR